MEERCRDRRENKGPLNDVTVLDFTRVLSGPYGTMWLADMGANVIKIENPADGDVTRAYPPHGDGMSAYFSTINRTKRGVTVNLKDERGKALIRKLVSHADVVTENFRPGVMDKLGLGYGQLSAINPKIVFASISGFGANGPDSQLPGYDVTAQGIGGLINITGQTDAPPTRAGSSVGDTLAGMNMVIGILAALNAREVTGKGQKTESNNHRFETWRRFVRNRPAMLGLILISAIALFLIVGNFCVDYEADVIRNDPKNQLLPPSAEHILGTDSLGRDILARIIYGGRYSLSIGILVTVISMSIGAVLGAACGYFGGAFDNIVMRLLDVISSLPSMLLTLAMVSALGASFINLVVAMSISLIPGSIRLIRSMVIALSDVEYIQAAKNYGTGNFRIIIKHVLPNALGVIIVDAAGSIAGNMIGAAGLSYLGFGVQPPAPEWGAMLSDAKNYMSLAPWYLLAPGIAILLTALSVNLIGDGLRDALDPRLKD